LLSLVGGIAHSAIGVQVQPASFDIIDLLAENKQRLQYQSERGGQVRDLAILTLLGRGKFAEARALNVHPIL
jgi:hypothetical protein